MISEWLFLNGIGHSKLGINRLRNSYVSFNQERNSKSIVRPLIPFQKLTLLANTWRGEAFVAKNKRIVYAR